MRHESTIHLLGIRHLFHEVTFKHDPNKRAAIYAFIRQFFHKTHTIDTRRVLICVVLGTTLTYMNANTMRVSLRVHWTLILRVARPMGMTVAVAGIASSTTTTKVIVTTMMVVTSS